MQKFFYDSNGWIKGVVMVRNGLIGGEVGFVVFL